MHSRKLKDFIDEIKYRNRNPRDVEVLKMLDDSNTNPTAAIGSGAIFYRCRIVDKNLDKINSEPGFKGYNAVNSFVPPISATKDLRANYRFIPYLYIASTKELSIIETCPLNNKVSVATILVVEDLMLFDLRNIKGLSDDRKIKDNLLIDLAELYCKPIESDDDRVDYIPTQFIAEYIKQLDYDGIIYPSSHATDKNKEYNVVVFNYYKCRATGSELIFLN